ncbi:hypothetical protein [Metakosakonia massiliensis]|uniref:Protoporphyrinogen IX oxidase n=1 Tax=Phytobacter massiliensis TaxID=1485952 RepID=A0A6N3G5N4_9ENTR
MNLHQWLNALHIFTAIIWTGGILVMAVAAGWCARTAGSNGNAATALAADIRGWSRRVTTPAMAVMWLMGLAMVVAHGQFPHAWLIIKLLLVVLLSAVHGILSATLRRFAGDEGRSLSGLARNATPVVVVAVAAIILLAVFRPF